MIERIGILGAGAWGTALAAAVTTAGRQALLWTRNAELAQEINEDHSNSVYLPRARLDPSIRATSDTADLSGSDALLLVVPAQHLRGIAGGLDAILPEDTPLVLCCKGIERNSGKLMTEVAAEALPGRPLAVLSGPTFAAEVASGLPTAVTLASEDSGLAAALAESLGNRSFRPYLSNDPTGAEVGGAVKNVIAIACGIVQGRALGDNARAALITRGLAEIVRLGLAKGGRSETLMGLSGFGDLTLTCTAVQSRNYALGLALGEGADFEDLMSVRLTVAEGVESAAAVTTLAKTLGIEMPISKAVNAILHQGADIDAVIGSLLARPFTSE
ncbi:NAD(P)H-dependent glycerol-3-phosphate dehydrogenase [Denitrobaculum tricleocarpae]|uniref:Glycerol-3-phosphate dehydrogenase [NAD(P)+] n=1 Tax=Denitrobaculum tricleocarpae TaxID=2591009 RepID=A0A545TR96_9PROT|nr:NAD(P)H-dependent glycerol-3-phosphate dehydrogenase [Denitrobaculum tricleocarpae]TQV79736.1 NAD(P)-dependent glycerol-3-phosphate dehydrogenase [Denitrobaculum tricleocarpae]